MIFLFLPQILLWLYQAEQIAKASEKSVVETWGMPAILLLLIGNVMQFLIGRGKMKSEVSKLDAETINSLIKSVGEIQDKNQTLFNGLQTSRDEARKLEEKLDHAEKELEACQDKKASCQDCRDALSETIDALTELGELLKKLAGTELLALDVKNLMTNLRRHLRNIDRRGEKKK